MRYIKDSDEALAVFNALGSEIRINILNLLIENGRMSMNSLAHALGISNGALTPHIRKLETCDLLRVNADFEKHGNLRICEPHLDKILFVLGKGQTPQNEYRAHLRVGQYTRCNVYPTCGLSTPSSLIGKVDDPRFFTHPKRFEADILWIGKGFVEYMIPCVIPRKSRIEQISVSMELSSEAPGSNPYWPSDIHFYLNDTLLGVWTSPGDFADVPGIFTPQWWYPNWNQYGLLKTLMIRDTGTYIDDMKLSDVSIDQLQVNGKAPMYLRLEVPDGADHVGGLTIFGRDFGNYNQDIEFRIVYSD